MKPVAIFRFSPTEGPGHFGDWLETQGIPYALFALDRGDPVPASARAFAGIGMMGGPMSANDDLPWNAPLLDLLRDAVSADVPVIGHCLGGQLFAKSLGAKVGRATATEIGWSEVKVIDAASNPWFGQRAGFRTFQWHHEVFGLPLGRHARPDQRLQSRAAFAFGKHSASNATSR